MRGCIAHVVGPGLERQTQDAQRLPGERRSQLCSEHFCDPPHVRLVRRGGRFNQAQGAFEVPGSGGEHPGVLGPGMSRRSRAPVSESGADPGVKLHPLGDVGHVRIDPSPKAEPTR